MDNTKVKIGALWKKQTKDGNEFFSGKMGDADLLIFKNTFKKQDNHPDYLVYVQSPKKKENAGIIQESVASQNIFTNDEIPF